MSLLADGPTDSGGVRDALVDWDAAADRRWVSLFVLSLIGCGPAAVTGAALFAASTNISLPAALREVLAASLPFSIGLQISVGCLLLMLGTSLFFRLFFVGLYWFIGTVAVVGTLAGLSHLQQEELSMVAGFYSGMGVATVAVALIVATMLRWQVRGSQHTIEASRLTIAGILVMTTLCALLLMVTADWLRRLDGETALRFAMGSLFGVPVGATFAIVGLAMQRMLGAGRLRFVPFLGAASLYALAVYLAASWNAASVDPVLARVGPDLGTIVGVIAVSVGCGGVTLVMGWCGWRLCDKRLGRGES